MKKSLPLKKAFTLVELLVVIAILGVLIAVLVSYSRSAIRKAEVSKCQDYLQQVQQAMLVCRQENGGFWPESLVNNDRNANGLDGEAAFALRKNMNLKVSSDGQRLDGSDKFGLLSTWAQKVVKDNGTSCSLSTHVPIGGTIADHRLRYALLMGDKDIIENVDPSKSIPGAKSEPTVDIRAEAVVWCYGPEGKIVHSWHDGVTKGAK